MDNMLLFFIEDEFCLALLNPEELVYLAVDLISNFFSSLKAHHDELGVLPCEQYRPEIIPSLNPRLCRGELQRLCRSI